MAQKNFGKVNVSITASTGGLTAGLSRASKQLAGFKQSAAGGLGGIGGMFANAARGAIGLGKGASLAAVGVSAMSMALKSLLAPLAIVAAVTAPFVAFAQATAAAERIHNLSQELGVASDQLQVLQAVGGEFGLSTEQMTGAMRRASRMTSELSMGTPAAQKAFAQLGLTMQDMAGLDAAQQFSLIADRIAALPPQMQAAAAIDIFGRSGQALLPFLRQGGDGIREMDRLMTDLGVKMSGPQVAAIEAMGDALGRLILPVQGFINQFLAGVAPAITAVSNLIVQFFAENTKGWTVATTLANGLVQGIRLVVGAMTILTGIFRIFMAFGAQIGQMFSEVFALILRGVTNVMKSMARLAEAAGFTDLAESLATGARGASQMARGAAEMGRMYGDSAAENFRMGVENLGNPFGAFDSELAKAKADAEKAAVTGAAGAAGNTIGNSITAAVRASSADLKAIVVGTSDGEAFRNSIMRGADPRLDVKEDQKRTADNTERAADTLDDIAGNLSGVALAGISV